MDFSKLKELTIPEGKVNQISVNGSVIWKAQTLKPVMADNAWLDIFNAFKNGTAPETWLVGDTKPMTLTDGTTYTIRLCDKKAGRYAYSDGSGSSKCVFEFVELIKVGSTTTFKMNSGDSNKGGWRDCYMRGTNIPKIEALLPDGVLSAISNVNVCSGKGEGSTSGGLYSANKLFLPAEMEILYPKSKSIGTTESPSSTFNYYTAHNTNAYRIKKQLGSTSGSSYWLRSPASGEYYYFCMVRNNGAITTYNSSGSCGIAPIFAI